MNLPGAVSTARLPERVRALATLINLHYAGAALLLLLNLYLAVAIGLAWRATSDAGTAALEQQELALKTAQLQARPLEGLDTKLITASTQADAFYDRRLPVTYSQVLTELGVLTKREGIKAGRIQYAQAPVLTGTPGALTEVRMDASLTGDYRPLVLFMNSLERDRMFFLIRGIALSGQQSGTVGLRLALTTFLRPGLIDDATVPLDSPAGNASPVASSAAVTQEAAPARASVAATTAVNATARSAPAAPAAAAAVPARSGRPFTPPPGGPAEIRSANPMPEGEPQP